MSVSQRTFQIFSAALLLLSLGWIYYSRTSPSPDAVQLNIAPQKGFLAPDFETQTLTGETIRLSDLRGKPVILNLWASWCPPCREEMPALQRIYIEYKDKGLLVLGFHMTAQDSQGAAMNFVRENGLTFPTLLDLDGEVSRIYHVQALPTTFFISSDGVIKDLIIGGPVSEAVFRAQANDLLQGVP
jgi:cytochrome c biogenesis protein CcmG, thiol:disulfide interchange protein DsbE